MKRFHDVVLSQPKDNTVFEITFLQFLDWVQIEVDILASQAGTPLQQALSTYPITLTEQQFTLLKHGSRKLWLVVFTSTEYLNCLIEKNSRHDMSLASSTTATIKILTWSQTNPFRAWCAQPLDSRLGRYRSHLRLVLRETGARLAGDIESCPLKSLGCCGPDRDNKAAPPPYKQS